MRYKGTFLLIFTAIVGFSCFFYFRSHTDVAAIHAIRIPVHFLTADHIPVIDLTIDGQRCSLLLDSGTYNLGLRQEVLERVQHKEPAGSVESFDIHGHRYLSPRFTLQSSIHIGHLKLTGVPIQEESLEFVLKGSRLWPSDTINPKTKKTLEHLSGKVGGAILLPFNCLFDFPHSAFYLAKNREELKKLKKGCLDGFIEVPLDLQKNGILISIETDLGMKKFLLDTGADTSVLKRSLIDPSQAEEFAPGKWSYTSHKFMIGNQDFGDWDFVLFEFPEHLTVDGILGIDFFRQYAVALDFENKTVFIEPPHQPLLSRMIDACVDFFYSTTR